MSSQNVISTPHGRGLLMRRRSKRMLKIATHKIDFVQAAAVLPRNLLLHLRCVRMLEEVEKNVAEVIGV